MLQVKRELEMRWTFLPLVSPDIKYSKNVWKALEQKLQARDTAVITREDKKSVLQDI